MKTSDKIALAGVFATFVAAGAAIAIIPEVRIFLGLEKPRVDGSWQYEMYSDQAQQKFHGSIDLTQNNEIVSGMMDNPDKDLPGKAAVEGTYREGTLKLSRPTNQQGVTQEYRLSLGSDGKLTGTFQNSVSSGPYKDFGSFEMHRQIPTPKNK